MWAGADGRNERGAIRITAGLDTRRSDLLLRLLGRDGDRRRADGCGNQKYLLQSHHCVPHSNDLLTTHRNSHGIRATRDRHRL